VRAALASSDCVRKLLEDFSWYDKTVDLVSCWQFLLTEVQQFARQTRYFDRFPKMLPIVPSSDSPKTPDFSVLLSDSYGLVADIKRGLPLDDENFLKAISNLLKYDRPLKFRAGPGSESGTPRDHDILLILPLRDANEIVMRIEKKRKEGSLKFERNLIVLEWHWDSDRNEYLFRKVAGQTTEFRDAALPDEIRFSKILSEQAASIKITPDKIKSIKAIWQFCNDAPPPIYTLVFLWTKILYHLLDPQQREIWRKRDPRTTIYLDLTTQRLTKEIQSRYQFRWGHWTDWARAALDALVQGGLARRTAQDSYVVGYRNLVRELGEPSHPSLGREGGMRHNEYARVLASYICRGVSAEEESESPAPVPPIQTKLFNA